MAYIAFLDMLGVSNLAAYDSHSYYVSLGALREATVYAADEFLICGEAPDKVFLFSDCAYVQSASISRLKKFMLRLRSSLMAQGYYIKASISKGILGEDEALNEDKIHNVHNYDKLTNIVFGHTFGEDVVNLYSTQNRLKGIGTWVSSDLAAEELARDVVISCHIPVLNNRAANVFYDLAYSNEYEVSIDTIYMILKSSYTSNAKDRKLGRYYITLLISLIQSIDFSNVSFDSDSKWESSNCPDIIKMLFDGRLLKALGDVVGIEYVYFAALNRLYETSTNNKIIDSAVTYISRNKRLYGHFHNVPDEILGGANRSKYLRRISDMHLPLVL